MPLTERENYLRTVARTGPEWIAANVVVSDASYLECGAEFDDVMAQRPVLFPGFEKGKRKTGLPGVGEYNHSRTPVADNWGCVFETGVDGLMGVIMHSPLAEWDALEGYVAPDALRQEESGEADWEQRRRSADQTRASGGLVSGGMPHGFLVMRLWYLRGFENLMLDLGSDDSRLTRLVETVQQHNRVRVGEWMKCGLDVLYFGEDLGTQTGPIIGPRTFRKWFSPAYRELFSQCHAAGTYVYLHSDGHVLDLIDEWLACGVDIVNVQDLCNGIENLEREVKGRTCICLDVDRQSVVPYGTRQEIHDLIEEEVRRLGSRAGGLELICGIYPPTPPENFDAVCEAVEKYRTYWW